jgi:hypothetical protein
VSAPVTVVAKPGYGPSHPTRLLPGYRHITLLRVDEGGVMHHDRPRRDSRYPKYEIERASPSRWSPTAASANDLICNCCGRRSTVMVATCPPEAHDCFPVTAAASSSSRSWRITGAGRKLLVYKCAKRAGPAS